MKRKRVFHKLYLTAIVLTLATATIFSFYVAIGYVEDQEMRSKTNRCLSSIEDKNYVLETGRPVPLWGPNESKQIETDYINWLVPWLKVDEHKKLLEQQCPVNFYGDYAYFYPSYLNGALEPQNDKIPGTTIALMIVLWALPLLIWAFYKWLMWLLKDETENVQPSIE